MTFNHIRKPWLYLLEGREKSPFAPIRNNLVRVSGMPGAYVVSKEADVLYIRQPVGFVIKNDEHALQIIDELAEWLITETAVPLQFDDEPGRTYYAEIEGTIEEFEKFVHQRRGVITFLCSDPYKYGPEKTVEPESDTFVVENEGTAETYPIITLTAKEPTTFAMISNGDEYMMVGRPYDALEVPKNTRPVILNDPASTLVGWPNFTGGFDFYGMGLVGGSMEVHGGYAFRPATYGSNPNGWTGPAIRKSLSEPLQDFEIEIDIAMLNAMRGVGRIVLVGLDASDKPVFSMQMVDPTNNYPNNRATFALGENNKTWFTYQGDAGRKVWNDGRFLLRISRQGQEFRARVARKLDPNGYSQTGRHTRSYTDTKNEYQNPVTQVAIYMARARTYDNVGMLFHHLRVNKLINLADYEVAYIAFPEDEIIFDHKTGDCYVNGESVPFDFGADFFTLKKGYNSLAVIPENTFETSIKYRERYR